MKTRSALTVFPAGLVALLAASLALPATFAHAQAGQRGGFHGGCGFHGCPHIKIIPPSTGCKGWRYCRNPAAKTYSNSTKTGAPAFVGNSASRRR
jgi:hypothetical protein